MSEWTAVLVMYVIMWIVYLKVKDWKIRTALLVIILVATLSLAFTDFNQYLVANVTEVQLDNTTVVREYEYKALPIAEKFRLIFASFFMLLVTISFIKELTKGFKEVFG